MTLSESIVQFGFSFGLIVNAALFVPQINAIFKTKSVTGVSLLTFAGFNLIQLFTIFHGLLHQDYILVWGNGLSFISCGAVSVLIVYYNYIKPTYRL